MGVANLVRSFTLDDIAILYQLKWVDFIKCDIGGAKALVFGDPEFFTRNNHLSSDAIGLSTR